MRRILIALLFIFACAAITAAQQRSEPKLEGYLSPDGRFVSVTEMEAMSAQGGSGPTTLIAKYLQVYASAPACSRIGQLYHNSATGKLGHCTATGSPGTWEYMASTSGAAPVDATYITETANSSLTNEFALGSLATGILKNTTTTGVPSIAVAGDFPTLNQNTTGTAANLSGTPALPNGTTATTQSQADNSTKLATTAYVDTLGATKQATITFGTGVQTALGVNVGSAGAPVLFNGAGGTPSSLTLTNASGLPLSGLASQATNTIVGNATSGSVSPTALAIGTCSTAGSALIWTTNTGFGCNTSITAAAAPVSGLTGAGTGVLTFLATPSSANARGALTDENGTGVALFDSNTSATFNTPVIAGGLTASGSGSNNFSGSTGAFQTSSGANTLNGATTISDATTPSLTTSAGKTNTGFVQINGKTSGAMKFLPVDATAQTVTIQTAAQTTGASTLTIPDQAGTSRNFVFDTLTQALTNKTINGNTLTAGTYTLTGAAGKTLTFNNSITLAGTDSTTMTFPSTNATIARTDAANTFTGTQTFSNAISYGGVTLTASVTGTGKMVLDTAPQFANGVGIGIAAPGTGLTLVGNVTAEANSGATAGVGILGISSNAAYLQLYNSSRTQIFSLSSATGIQKIAGTATRATTEGTNHLDIFDGTAPVGTLANGISLYSTSGELRVMDSAGNATLLSPHDHLTNEWIFNSVNTVTGKAVRFDMERMVRYLNARFGTDFVHDGDEATLRPDLLNKNNVTASYSTPGDVAGTKVVTPTPGATVTVTIANDQHIIAAWTASEIETVNISGTPLDGQRLTMIITNDGVLGRVITLGSGLSSLSTIIGVTSKKSTVSFIAYSGTFYEVSRTVGF